MKDQRTHPVHDRHGNPILSSHCDRYVACTNACAGISNLDGIAVMRKALWDMSTGSIPSGEVRALATHALNVLRGASQAPVAAAPGWQPIETAPKDGTHILAHNGNTYYPAVVIHWFESGWFFSTYPTDIENEYDPVRWMPLPTPPQV